MARREAAARNGPEKAYPGLDPRVETGFPKKSCSTKEARAPIIQPETIAL
jgi:hypothetical protein